MKIEHKYTKDAIENGVGTSNGFWYDISDGGYIDPEKILLDKNKAKKIKEAVELLEEWLCELQNDEILNEY